MSTKSLIRLIQPYFEKDPTMAAAHLEKMEEKEAIGVLKEISPPIAVAIFPHLSTSVAAHFLKTVPSELFIKIVEGLAPQQGAAIFLKLSPEERSALLDHLTPATQKNIQEILHYPEDSAGRMMTSEFTALRKDLLVRQAIEKIRSMVRKGYNVLYVYVIDEENHLVGVLNMRDLMLAGGSMLVEDVMRRDVFSIPSFMDREEIANKITDKGLMAAPVIDAENHLLGILKTDQILHHVQEEDTEDIQKMFGAGGDERAFSPIRFSLKTRLPWLHVNLVTAFLAAFVVGLFEEIIAKITVLAVFLPVVAGQGGNAGAQSLAVVMRGLVMREIPKGRVRHLILKESIIGMCNGIIVGLVTGITAWFWKGNPFLGVVIALAMMVNLFMAGFSGALIPITMKALGLDPAQSSNIILTTITDVVGFLAFLGFAMIFQSYLV